jgi:proteic killer suppression protein
MIRSFGDRETELVWSGVRSRKLPGDIQNKALVKLTLLNRSANLDDLKIPPGNRLERLKGERRHQHSIRINGQWQICFEWREGHAYGVEIVDYH